MALRVYRCADCALLQIRFFPDFPNPCPCGSLGFKLLRPVRSSDDWPHPRNPLANVIRGGVISNCKVAVRMEAGAIAEIHGMDIVDSPVAFDIDEGADVDFYNVSHRFTDESSPRRRRSRKRRRAG